MTSLDGVRALVTGSTSGLGLAMASALASAGASVAVTGRSADRAEAVAARLDGSRAFGAARLDGSRAFGLAMDVRSESSVRAGVEAVRARLGGVDLLVNNAGIGMRTVNPRFLTEPQPFPGGRRRRLSRRARDEGDGLLPRRARGGAADALRRRRQGGQH